MITKILITGGAGFIGSHVVRRFVNKYPNYHIYNLDALTYAGNLENISDIEHAFNYTFIKGDIVDEGSIKSVRPGFGAPPKMYDEIIGKKVINNVSYGSPVKMENLE